MPFKTIFNYFHNPRNKLSDPLPRLLGPTSPDPIKAPTPSLPSQPPYLALYHNFNPIPPNPIMRPPRLRPHILLRKPQNRTYTTTPPNPPPKTRLSRILSRLPPRLQHHLHPLTHAPISHITTFLLLHELSAIIPLLGLASLFHYTGWIPSWFSEGTWVLYGVEKFGNWFRRRGWIDDGTRDEVGVLQQDVKDHENRGNEEKEEEEEEEEVIHTHGGTSLKKDKWDTTQDGVRIVVEFATAYAIVKALLPLRIMASVWATPWFASRVVIPMGRRIRTVFRRGTGKKKSGGGGVK